MKFLPKTTRFGLSLSDFRQYFEHFGKNVELCVRSGELEFYPSKVVMASATFKS